MRIKHYETEDLLGTTDQIRREMGREAVILATRKLGTSGLLRRRPRFEVIAGTMAEEPEDDAAAAIPAAKTRDDDSGSPAVRLALSEAATARRVAAAAAQHAATAELSSEEANQMDGAIAAICDVSTAQRPPKAGRTDTENGSSLAVLSRRLADIEQEVTRFRGVRRSLAEGLPRDADEALERLAERGLGRKTIAAITADIIAADGEDGVRAVRRALMSRLPSARSLRIARGKRLPIVLAGPAGAGKTTAAIKLALSLKAQGHRVVLATVDTLSTAGEARLVAFGRALDLPVRVCYGAGELTEAMTNGAFEAIVIDTPSFNAYQPETVAEWRKLIAPAAEGQVLLVVPAGIASTDLEAARELVGAVNGLVITSSDATGHPGGAINVMCETKLPALFIGDSSDVMQPLRAADRESLARLAFGEALRVSESAAADAADYRVGA